MEDRDGRASGQRKEGQKHLIWESEFLAGKIACLVNRNVVAFGRRIDCGLKLVLLGLRADDSLLLSLLARWLGGYMR